MSTLTLDSCLVGRESMVRTVLDKLRRGARVIALHGLPGVGKTCLLHTLEAEVPDCKVVDDLDQLGSAELAKLNREVQRGGTWLFASRKAPAARWFRSLPPGTFSAVEVGGLEQDSVDAFLQARNGSGTAAAIRQSRGHPLYLLAMLDHKGSTVEQSPAMAVQLLKEFGARSTSPSLRQALWVCAMALTTNEPLLRATLLLEDTASLFDRLQEFSFVKPVAGGLRMDPLVAEVVLAEARWRDPAGCEQLRSRLAAAVEDRCRSIPQHVEQLLHLVDDPTVITAGPPAHEGDLVLQRSELASDPLGAVVLELVQELGLRARHQVMFVRRWAGSPRALRSLLETAVSTPHLGALVFAGVGPARPGDRELGDVVLRVHDTRATGVAGWLRRTISPSAQPMLALELLDEEAFADAVREALRAMAQTDGELRMLRFARTTVAMRAVGSAETERHEVILRDFLGKRIEELADPRARRAVQQTYTRGAPKQFTVASELGLSFATYRRSLAKGTQALIDRLWESEDGEPVFD